MFLRGAASHRYVVVELYADPLLDFVNVPISFQTLLSMRASGCRGSLLLV